MEYLTLLIVVIGYILGAFVTPVLSVPLLRRQPLPTRVPSPLKDAITQIAREADSPYGFINGACEYLLSQNHSRRTGAIINWMYAFETDTRSLLDRRGYMHGHHLNHLMRLMLAKSPYFTDKDLRLRYTILNGVVHQYLQARVAGQWYDIDLLGVSRGLPLGKTAWGFR